MKDPWRTKTLKDGTEVDWCTPHQVWEWTCQAEACGQTNSERDLYCTNCCADRSRDLTSWLAESLKPSNVKLTVDPREYDRRGFLR